MDVAGLTQEQALLQALRAGDERAFAALVDRHTPGLLRVARAHVRDAAAAEEVVQETWLALLDGLERFEGRSSVQTWLYRVVLFRSRSRGVRDARTVPLSSLVPEPGQGPTVDPARFRARRPLRPGGQWVDPPRPWQRDPALQLESAEVLALLRRAIDALPERQREVLVLRDVEGLTADEVALTLDLMPGNVRVLLHRARAKVRQALEDELS